MNECVTKEDRADSIRAELAQCCGAEEWYRSSFPHFIFTSGVRQMAESCGAYWLIDLIGSHQPRARHSRDLYKFQHWVLTLNKTGRGAKARCFRDEINGRPEISQRVPYTDFPLPEGIELYVEYGDGNWTLMLRSEH